MSPDVNVEELLNECAEIFKSDTQFLIDQGWQKTDKTEINGEKVFSVWISPSGEECAHQTHLIGGNFNEAINVAQSELIKKMGFKAFSLRVWCPEFDLESNQRLHDSEDGWDNKYYAIHPVSHKVYTWMEAVFIARYNEMKDLDETTGGICKQTIQIQQIIDEQQIQPQEDMDLYTHFVPENGNHVHKFHDVKYK